jgi:hypothetical protein
MFASRYQCPDCGSLEGYRSRRRTFTERFIYLLLFLQPVRCSKCFRRSVASSFAPVRERREKCAPVVPRAAA